VYKAHTAIVLYERLTSMIGSRHGNNISRLRLSLSQKTNGGNGGSTGKSPGAVPTGEKSGFCQRAYDALYGDKQWLWVFNQLYYWNDTYYEAVDTNAEILINHYLDSYEAL